MIHVVSTGFRAPTKQRCLDSVRGQTLDCVHHYVEASNTVPPDNVITNLTRVVDRLEPTDVVVWLDGDDWLLGATALETVQAYHSVGAWVTYGSFEYSDGRPGFAAEYKQEESVRASPWRATHLRSFRAGLLHRLREEDRNGWKAGEAVPWDMVVMFACIEMAGWERADFCPDVLCVYNFASSHEFRHGPSEERAIEREIRAEEPYTRIVSL